ncbi:tetratricopeptide repeat protein [Hufsiella ginkgonis]|uniref:Tetratricopeptide repeat protein n=1 Tax=Hufsiella ginkgonis TaxID=2695274 RepID=A0A7K1Y046_9SPHI|nr:tetratricopeptide repeat protein [Hufsiella ginkgonis]MXV16562.1 tetratricopeptide repeat protein [Hufsiella ginkgonis]
MSDFKLKWYLLLSFLYMLPGLRPATLKAQSNSELKRMNIVAKLATEHPDSAYTQLKILVVKARQDKNRIAEATSLQQMGQVLHYEGNYAGAISHLLEARKIFQEENQTRYLAQTLNYLGNVYYYNKQPRQARKEFNEALRLFRKLNDDKGIAESYGEIGHLYEKKMTYDSAYLYQQLAMTHLVHIGDSASLAKIYENIASIMEDQERYDSSLYYYRASLRLNERFHNTVAQIEIVNNLGDIYRKTGRYSTGLQYSKRALVMAQQMNEKYQLSSAYRDIGRSYGLMKQYDSAYYYTELARVSSTEVYDTENSRQIALTQVLFDTEKKSSEITRLNAEKRVNIIVTTASVIIFFLLLLLAVLIYLRQKLKIKTEQEIRQTQQLIFKTENGLLEAELKNKQLEESRLKQQLELKSKELSSHVLHLIQKNEVLETIKTDMNALLNDDKRDHKKQLKQLIHKINISVSQDTYWREFRVIFEQVHESFFDKVKAICGDLTANDLRLVALLKMNLSSTDIATLLGISPDSLRVIRYRLRKKLKLGQGETLSTFLQSL